jgi:hypothetical protein
MSIGSRVVLAITFQKVDNAPDTKTCAQGHYESLKNFDSRVKEFHSKISFGLKKATLHTPEIHLLKRLILTITITAESKRKQNGCLPSIASQEISTTFKQHICDMQFNVVAVALKELL